MRAALVVFALLICGTAQAADRGFTVLIPPAASVSSVSSFLDSRAAGCAPNAPGTDAQTCLAAWLDTCRSQHLICVFGGVYYVSNTLVNNSCVYITGISMHGSGLIGNPGMTTPLMSVQGECFLEAADFSLVGNNSQVGLRVTQAAAMELWRLSLSGNVALQTGDGVNPSNVVNWHMRDIEATGQTYAADFYAPGDSFLDGSFMSVPSGAPAAIHVSANGGIRGTNNKCTGGIRGWWYTAPVDSIFEQTGGNCEGQSASNVEIDGPGTFNNVAISGFIGDNSTTPVNLTGGSLTIKNISIMGAFECTGTGPAVSTNSAATGIVAISIAGCGSKYNGASSGVAVY